MKTINTKNIILGVLVAVVMTAVSFSTAFAATDEMNDTETGLRSVELPDRLERVARTAELVPLQSTARQPASSYVPGGIPLIATENNDHYPSLATDGSGNVLAMAEMSVSTFDSGIGMRYSDDGGGTWNPAGDIISWEIEGLERFPTIDYTGGSDFQGYGTYMPDPGIGRFPLIHFPSLSDPEAVWQDDQGWTVYGFDASGYYESYDGIDVAGYLYGEDIAPYPDFHGIITSTCIDSDTGLDTISLVYETEDLGLQLLYFPELQGLTSDSTCDIDTSTGEYYEAFEWKDEPDVIEDGVYLDHAYLEPGNPDWWSVEGEWQGFIFEDAHNPDVAAANGNCYLVYEWMDPTMGTTDIVCAYSNDNGDTFNTVQLTETGLENEKYPVVSVVGNTVICAYYLDGDIYTVISEDGGATWEQQEGTVNEESGTVVDEYGAFTLAGQYIAWTDSSGDTNDVYFDLVLSAPVIGITGLSGGFGITATVTNTGTEDAEDVAYTIAFDALIGGTEKTGTVSVPVGSEAEIKSGFIIGLGPADITINVGGVTATASGFVLGPFVFGL